MPPHILSRKVQASISDGIDRLRFASFTERDLKLLLIDLREIANYIKNTLKSESNKFTAAISDFLDICDFIAHPNRNKGRLEGVVRAHIKKLYSHLNISHDEHLKIPVENILNAEHIVSGLIAVTALALRERNKSDFLELESRQLEISLCILSLLQDSIITLGEEEGLGILQLVPHEGKYRIYCRLLNTRIERESKARTGGSGSLHIIFPVIFSDAICADPEISSLNFCTPNFPIFETYRDESKHLKIRIIS